MIIATKSRHYGIVHVPIASNANVHHLIDNEGENPLHWETKIGDARLLSLLMNHTLLEATNNKGRTTLAMAAKYGYGQIFKFLLEKGALVHTTDHNRRTILHQACLTVDTRILIFVLTQPIFTNPLFIPENLQGEKVLHYACRMGNKAAVATLLKEEVQLNAFDLQGRAPLLLAIYKGRTNIAKTLLNTTYSDYTEVWSTHRITRATPPYTSASC